MKLRLSTPILALALLLSLGACDRGEKPAPEPTSAISGHIDQGLRVLTIDPAKTDQTLRIYRGDYVQPEVAGGGTLHLVIEDLAVDTTYPAAPGMKPYFKVPDVGTFKYTAGQLSGVIEAIDYTAGTYREVNAKEAAELIENLDPFILDVRTEREFAAGHISGAHLIPVQVLQRRIAEMDAHQDRPIFVYCRTGNRSTVAARMLIDRGGMQVINLRHGIVEWERAGLPVQK